MTPAAMRAALLDPALEARAHNLHQDQILFNPTEAIDSIAEHLVAAKRSVTGSTLTHLERALALLADLHQSNRQEGSLECRVAGAADRLAADAHSAVTHGAGPGAKRIARELRPALADIANPMIAGPRERAALQVVRSLAASVPAEVLLSPRVRHELGGRKTDLLASLLAGVVA